MKQKLHLSENSKMIGGVCGGLAESLGVDFVCLYAWLNSATVYNHVGYITKGYSIK